MDVPTATTADRITEWFRQSARAHARKHGEGCDVVEARALLALAVAELRDYRTTLTAAVAVYDHDSEVSALHERIAELQSEVVTRDHVIAGYRKRLKI